MPTTHEQTALQEAVREAASSSLSDSGYSQEEQDELSLTEIVEEVDEFTDGPDDVKHYLSRYEEALNTLATVAVEWDVPPGELSTDVKVAAIEEYNARGVDFSE